MLALERAQIDVDRYVAYEIDKYATSVSKKHHQQIEHMGSVVGADFTRYAGFDLLIGGSPCQDLSIAKSGRSGLDGSQSGLFYEYARALREVNPKYFLLENVASMSRHDRQVISDILGVEPIMINSSLVSAQQRKRLYWTNIPNVTQPEDKCIVLSNILLDDVDHDVSPVSADVCYNSSVSSTEPTFRPCRVGQIGKGGQGDRVYGIYGKSVSLSANGGGRGAKTGLYKIGDSVRKLHPIECERLQTLPDGYTAGISDTQRYKCIGNGWTVDVIAHILSHMKGGRPW